MHLLAQLEVGARAPLVTWFLHAWMRRVLCRALLDQAANNALSDLGPHTVALLVGVWPVLAAILLQTITELKKVLAGPRQALTAPFHKEAVAGALGMHLIVATAAKEHHVPVVGLSSTFLLTPQFAHSSHEGLGQLLSPSMIVQYNANLCQENVEVVNPAYDFLPPAVMDLYVTNNGSHQPSYIYRLLSEFYCPADHIL